MTALSYLAQSLPWGIVGLLVGHLLTRGAFEFVAEVAHPEGRMNEKKPNLLRRWLTYDRIIGLVVFTLAVATVVQGYVASESTRRIAECTRGYSNGFADALDARSSAATAEREALVQWMRTLDELMTKAPLGGDPAAARQRFAAATSEYLKKQAELRQKQQENPYPDPPRDICK